MLRVLAGSRDKLYGIHRAKVINSSDPLGRGRVQVQVYPLMEGVNEEDLPWAEPCYGGWMKIPQPGNWVWVMFIEGEITAPVYMGWSIPFDTTGVGLTYQAKSQGSTFNNTEFIGKEVFNESNVEYPAGAIFRHESGSIIAFHNSGTVQISTANGDLINLNSNGNIVISNASGDNITLNSNDTINITNNAGASINLNSSNITISGSVNMTNGSGTVSLGAGGNIILQGTVTLQGAITVNGPLAVNGSLTVNGQTVCLCS